MPQQIVDIPGVGEIEFPDTMGQADIDAAARKLYEAARGEMKWPPTEPAPPPGLATRVGRAMQEPGRESLISPSRGLTPVERANLRTAQQTGGPTVHEKPGGFRPPQEETKQTAFEPLLSLEPSAQKYFPSYEGIALPEQAERGFAIGMARIIEGFSSPASLVTIAAAGGLSALSNTLKVLITMGFSGMMGAEAIIKAPEIVHHVKAGEYDEAFAKGTETLVMGGLAVGLGGSAVRGGRSHPWVTGREMILDPRGPGGRGRPLEPRVYEERPGLPLVPAHEQPLFPGRPTELPGSPAAGALGEIPRQPRPGVPGVPSTQGIYSRGTPPEPGVRGLLPEAPGVDIPGAGPGRRFRGGARMGEPAPTTTGEPIVTGEQTVTPTGRPRGLFGDELSNVERQQRLAPDFVGPPEPPVRPELGPPLLTTQEVQLPPGPGGGVLRGVPPGEPGGLGPFRQGDIVPTGRPGVPARVREPGRFRVREEGDPSGDLLREEPMVEPEGPITRETVAEATADREMTFEEAEAAGKVKIVRPPKTRNELGREWYAEGTIEDLIMQEGGLKLDLTREEHARMLMQNVNARTQQRSHSMFDPLRARKGEDAMTPDQMWEVLKDQLPERWTQADFEAALTDRTKVTPEGKRYRGIPSLGMEDTAEIFAQMEAESTRRLELPGMVEPELPRSPREMRAERPAGEPPRTLEEAEADYQRGRQQIEEMREDPNYAGTDFEKLEVDNSLNLQRNLQRIEPVKPTTRGPGFGPEEPVEPPVRPEPDIERLRGLGAGEREPWTEADMDKEVWYGTRRGTLDALDAAGENAVILFGGRRGTQLQVKTSELTREPPASRTVIDVEPEPTVTPEGAPTVKPGQLLVKRAEGFDQADGEWGVFRRGDEGKDALLRQFKTETDARWYLDQQGKRTAVDPDLERLRKPRELGAPRPEVGEAAFPGRVEPTTTPEGEPVSFAEGREAYQERIRQVEGYELDLAQAADPRPPTPSEKLPIPPDAPGGVEVTESPEYKAFWEEHAAEYGKLSDIVDRIELSGLERAERARAEAVRTEAERRLAEIDNRSAEIPDEPTPGPKAVEPTVTPEGQVEIVGHKGFLRESRLADDKAKLENILTTRPDPTTAIGKKQIIELGKREKELRESIAEQERELRAEPEQVGMFAEDEPPLFEREPTPKAELPPEEQAGLFAEEPKVEPEGRPKEPLQDPLIAYKNDKYVVQRTPTGQYDVYLGTAGRGNVIKGKKVKEFRYRTDAVQWADKQARKEPTVQAELPEAEGKPLGPSGQPRRAIEVGDQVDSGGRRGTVQKLFTVKERGKQETKAVVRFTDGKPGRTREVNVRTLSRIPEEYFAEDVLPPAAEPAKPTSRAGGYVDSLVEAATKPESPITTEVANFAKAYLNWKLGDQKLTPPRMAGDMPRSVKGLIDSLVEADKPTRGPGGQSTLYSNPIQPAMDWWSKRVGPKIWRFIASTKEPYGILVKPWPEPVKWLFINRHRQPATWVERHREWQRKTEEGAQESFKLGQQMTRKLSQEDQLLLGDLLKGKANEAELRAMRENPEWQAAIDAVKTARSKFDEYAGLAAEQKLLSEENFFLNHGKYMPRLYRRYEVDYDAQLRKYGASRPTRLDQDRYKKRQDIPEEIRVLRGEILEPGYPVAKGLAAVIHDVETSKLFNFVADNQAWTVSPERMVELGKDPKKYTLMPTTTKLGRLSGQYVDKYIASELNQMTKPRGELEKLSRRLVSEWKVFKVIFNPPTHGRNMISNSMLAYLDGLGPWRVDIYSKAISQLWNQKGEYYDAAKAEGLFSTTFTKGELTPLIDSWNSTKGGLYDRFAGMAENFEKGEVAAGLGKVLPSGTRAGQRAAKIYQGEEAWFKLARYIKAVEDGATPKQAAAQAQKALFDYTEVPPFVNWARTSPVGAPFITFTYKALPQILETGITHPWRLGALVYGIYAAEEAARKHLGISEDQMAYLKRIMPDRMRGNPLGLGPKALLLPFTDKYGQLQYLDLTYILPWGDIGEQGATGIYQGSPIHAAPMRAIYEITINKSSYTGQEIYGENDSKKVVAQKISDYVYKFVAPSLAPAIPGVTEGGYGFERIWKSIWGQEDYFGRVSAPTTAIASAIIGLKMNPVDEDIELFFRQKEFEDGFDDITAAAYRVQNHQGLSEEEKNLQLDELRERMRLLREIAQDMIYGPEQEQQEAQPQQSPVDPVGPAEQREPIEPQVQPEQ